MQLVKTNGHVITDAVAHSCHVTICLLNQLARDVIAGTKRHKKKGTAGSYGEEKKPGEA